MCPWDLPVWGWQDHSWGKTSPVPTGHLQGQLPTVPTCKFWRECFHFYFSLFYCDGNIEHEINSLQVSGAQYGIALIVSAQAIPEPRLSYWWYWQIRTSKRQSLTHSTGPFHGSSANSSRQPFIDPISTQMWRQLTFVLQCSLTKKWPENVGWENQWMCLHLKL